MRSSAVLDRGSPAPPGSPYRPIRPTIHPRRLSHASRRRPTLRIQRESRRAHRRHNRRRPAGTPAIIVQRGATADAARSRPRDRAPNPVSRPLARRTREPAHCRGTPTSGGGVRCREHPRRPGMGRHQVPALHLDLLSPPLRGNSRSARRRTRAAGVDAPRMTERSQHAIPGSTRLPEPPRSLACSAPRRRFWHSEESGGSVIRRSRRDWRDWPQRRKTQDLGSCCGPRCAACLSVTGPREMRANEQWPE